MFNRELKPTGDIKSKRHYKLSKFFDAISEVFFFSIFSSMFVGVAGAIISVAAFVVLHAKAEEKVFSQYFQSEEYRQDLAEEISSLGPGEGLLDQIKEVSSKDYAKKLFYKRYEGAQEESKQREDDFRNKEIMSAVIGGSVALGAFVFWGLSAGADALARYEKKEGDRLQDAVQGDENDI